MKTILQAAQIKCIGLSLKLKDRPNIKSKDFKIKNWLQFHERVSQCSIYKVFTKNCSNYFDETYVLIETVNVYADSSYQNLNLPRQKVKRWTKNLIFC